MTPKKIPLRRCAGCGEQKEKRALIRVVRTPEGEIKLDSTGKANGRGVYLCPDASCLKKARKANHATMARKRAPPLRYFFSPTIR